MSSTDNTTVSHKGACPYCSTDYSLIYHNGGLCPKIKAIEYHPDGDIKRVEFFSPGDYLQPLKTSDWGSPPTITWTVWEADDDYNFLPCSSGTAYSSDDFRGWKISY